MALFIVTCTFSSGKKATPVYNDTQRRPRNTRLMVKFLVVVGIVIILEVHYAFA